MLLPTLPFSQVCHWQAYFGQLLILNFEDWIKKNSRSRKMCRKKQRVARIGRDMNKSYDKRINILIHGLKKTERANKQQTKTVFEAFLREPPDPYLILSKELTCTFYLSARSRKQIKSHLNNYKS